ncbi:hypothetical protein Z950_2976 [Sulfitobacter mediterraneus KCTC 32188]|nr:hypothetical protein Z950_2976 [Sulfitobacter mediterraneus KCTC 32188]
MRGFFVVDRVLPCIQTKPDWRGLAIDMARACISTSISEVWESPNDA